MNAPSAPRPPELVAASDSPVELVGERVSISAAVDPDARSLLRSAVEDRSDGRRIYVVIDDIEADANPGLVYGVYLNRPDEVTDEDGLRYHIGNVSLFGIEETKDPDARDDQQHGMVHSFDVTERVAELAATDEWKPDQLTVTFEPVLPLPPPFDPETDTPEAREDRERARSEDIERYRSWGAAAPVTIGRVGLFVEVNVAA